MDAVVEMLSLKTPLVAGWIVLLAAAERLAPAARRPAGEGRVVRNLGLWAGNALLSIAIVVPLTAVAAAHPLGLRPGWTAGLLADLLLLDLWIYAWHRANHALPVLWRFHQVHHRDQFLDVTSALRFHPGEVALSALARAMVVMAFDIPLTSVVAFEALILLAAIFHHSNVKLPAGLERALSWLVVTPSIHWVHHHAVRRDTDSNYATILSLWDRLFASRSPTARRPDMPIGAEGAAERGLAGLLLLPFRRS